MSLQAAHDYLAAPHLEAELRAELEPLVKAAEAGDAEAIAELDDRFSEPLAFGTGGLRGLMGAGLKRMNAVNVRRATMALATVTQRRAPGKQIALVGYDTRLNSKTYGEEAARTLAAAGYEVYLGTRPLPTPFLCFAMRELGAACGVILTASHNPKAYNGYKAYDDRGAQLV
ncbi:MAG: phospho-sugar mutase, partial [Proteobacteria bacterium]|nr:phospho-sugar mutase [Pseudomonadota bacterium]